MRSVTLPGATPRSHLVRTGFFGKNRAEAAERILERAIERMVEENKIPRRPD
jgi:hypothetical protein